MSVWFTHLVLVPVVLPLLVGALLLVFDGLSRPFKAAINMVSVTCLLAVSITLLHLAKTVDAVPFVYLLGNWPAPFGIVFVLDQLSALMLVLTSVLGLASLTFSLARWHKAGVHFHALFQFQLMGLNGAFLTGDLFNLFVFFEVMLAASYGLVLHGSGVARVKAGMHYIAVNLATSSVFLIGAALLYGATGTLNLADLAERIAQMPEDNRLMIEVGAAILGIAFMVKAGMWPLSFWLPTAYRAATPPVAAIFAIMSKVGIYVLLRLSLLFFGDHATTSSGFGNEWLLYGGIMTMIFGMVGVLSSQDTGRIAGFAVLVSSGTLLSAIGFSREGVTAAALYYLISSTLAISAFFLLIELVERGREFGADMLAVTREAYGEVDDSEAEDEEEETGVPIPATMAILGLSFICCSVLLAGLPPLSGFIGKFTLLLAMLQPLDPSYPAVMTPSNWAFIVVIILSGFATLIAMTRAGIRSFWGPLDREIPRVSVVEFSPIAILLLLCISLTAMAAPAMQYMETTAHSLHMPDRYIQNVLSKPRLPKPFPHMDEEAGS